MKLFIDDERFPVDESFQIVRSSTEAIDWVKKNGLPSEIAFDHDLGGDDTSMVFIKWLADFMLDNDIQFPEGFRYSVHSQNPAGAMNIHNYMDNFVQFLSTKG